MKVLILNGSPRRSGKVSQILHTMEKRLQDDGNETEFVDVNTLVFKCCIGCMKCRESGKCILPQDDAHHIGEALQNCDAVIIGSPVYWGNINGKLKCLFDRQVAVMMGENKMGIPIPLLKGKKAFLTPMANIKKAIEYVNAALMIEDRGVFHYFLAYIKFDFYARKFLRISPDWREELVLAQATTNLSPTDCDMLFDILAVERPAELTVF